MLKDLHFGFAYAFLYFTARQLLLSFLSGQDELYMGVMQAEVR